MYIHTNIMYPTLSSEEIHNKNPTSILQHIHPRQDMELGLHSHPQMIHPPHFHTPYYHKSFPVYPTNTISNKQPKVWTGVLHELFGWTQTWMKGFVKGPHSDGESRKQEFDTTPPPSQNEKLSRVE
jgi:hypothetical protein